MERIRPSLRELQQRRANDDDDDLAFGQGDQAPAATVVRTKAPKIASTTMPDAVPTITSFDQLDSANSAAKDDAPRIKPKSRFAMQREQQQQRFTIDFDNDAGKTSQPSGPRLIGSVFERDTVNTPIVAPSIPGPSAPSPLARPLKTSTGFPQPVRGVFASTKLGSQKSSVRETAPAPAQVESSGVRPSSTEQDSATSSSVSDLMASVSQENERVLANMSPAEIEEHQRQIRQELGLSDSIIKMLEARGRSKATTSASTKQVRFDPESIDSASVPTPSASSSRIRPDPTSLPKPRLPPTQTPTSDDPDEGSPEYIRRHFFPNEPPNPNLDWMRPRSATSATSTSEDQGPAHVFGLDGHLLNQTFPTGRITKQSDSHHVSSSTEFSIPTLMALTSSAVSSQRSTALTVLERILSRTDNETNLGTGAWNQLRIKVMTRAGMSLHDKHAGVVAAALDLAGHVLRTETWSRMSQDRTSRPTSDKAKTVLDAFLSTHALEALAQQLMHPRLDPVSLTQVIDVLQRVIELGNPRSSVKAAIVDDIVQTSSLLESFNANFISVSWPCSLDSTTSAIPQPAAIKFFNSLAQASRSTAKHLFEKGFVESTLRFLSVAPWELDDEPSRTFGLNLLVNTLEFWTTLARYGIATSLRSKGSAVIEPLLEHIASTLQNDEACTSVDKHVACAIFELLHVWTVAAIDPHLTNHDITWSQVESWSELAVDGILGSMRRTEKENDAKDEQLVASGLKLLSAWLTGCRINKERQGADQRQWVQDRLEDSCLKVGSRGGKVFKRAFERFGHPETSSDERDQAAAMVLAVMHLCQTLGDGEKDAKLWQTRFGIINVDLSPIVKACSSTTVGRHVSALLLMLCQDADDTRNEAALAITLLAKPGDEVQVRDELNRLICKVATTNATFQLPESALKQCQVLGPFIQHALVTASGGRVVAPLYPTTKDIKLTSVQYPFVDGESPVLEPTWPMSAIDELLRSSSSPVFQHLPKGWDASELDVLQGALALTVLFTGVATAKVSRPQILFDLIKVFMLEKEAEDSTSSTMRAQTTGVDRDLFRNEVVQDLMQRLLDPLRISTSSVHRLAPDNRSSKATVEGPSARVSSAPFYQLYTDLIGLYDSISLGDKLFSSILLPPLSMAYPSDFRRLFWLDYSHNLKRISSSIGDVVSDHEERTTALASFLEPNETNETVLMAFGQALAKGEVIRGRNEFLHFVAMHHVNQALFSVDESRGAKIEVRQRLVKSLLLGSQEGLHMLKTVASYIQVTEHGAKLRLPPQCFESSKEIENSRKQTLLELAGPELAGKIEQALA
ncbi:hypothetical protein OIO90_005135 [Microbotryomycetes sp. JL221]|nr:hypothetical protein OIO90_005135 [Microbotryomycetes sp. JL221]